MNDPHAETFPKTAVLATLRESLLDKLASLRDYLETPISIVESPRAIERGGNFSEEGASAERFARQMLLDQADSFKDSLNALNMLRTDCGELSGVSFQHNGTWNVERFYWVSDIQEIGKMATFLDEDRFTNIADAVEALNSGAVSCPEGYCVGWSEFSKMYYFLHSEEATDVCAQILVDTNAQKQLDERKKRKQRFQRWVGSTLKAKYKDEAINLVYRYQANIEGKIRKCVTRELNDKFEAEVIQAIEDGSASIRANLSEQIQKLDNERQIVIELQNQDSVGFQREVEEMSKVVQRTQISAGAHGQFAACYAQLADVKTLSTRLASMCAEAHEYASKEIQCAEDTLAALRSLEHAEESGDSESSTLKWKSVQVALAQCGRHSKEIERIRKDLALADPEAHLLSAGRLAADAMFRVNQAFACECSDEEASSATIAVVQKMCWHFESLAEIYSSWRGRLQYITSVAVMGHQHVDVKISSLEALKAIEGTDMDPPGSLLDLFCAGVQGEFRGRRPIVAESKKPPKRPEKNPAAIKVGDCVRDLYTRKLVGIARFIGTTDFAEGEWVGINLDKPLGKNNGSVNGSFYFHCDPWCGIFLRPCHLVKVVGRRCKRGKLTQQKRMMCGVVQSPREMPRELPREMLACTYPQALRQGDSQKAAKAEQTTKPLHMNGANAS